jgi:hypothetical protein
MVLLLARVPCPGVFPVVSGPGPVPWGGNSCSLTDIRVLPIIRERVWGLNRPGMMSEKKFSVIDVFIRPATEI